jgi:hypothetical protein
VACAGDEVTLADAGITVQSNRIALVTLDCQGSEDCTGRLTLSAKTTSKTKGKKKRSSVVTIGTAQFSIGNGKTSIVKIDLNTRGRTTLKADHRSLSAQLVISELNTQETLSEDVRLTEQAVHSLPVGKRK